VQEGFLNRILRVVHRAEHPAAVSVELRLVLLDDAAKCALVPAANCIEQFLVPRRLDEIRGGRVGG
jgi:hypothetical protein